MAAQFLMLVINQEDIQARVCDTLQGDAPMVAACRVPLPPPASEAQIAETLASEPAESEMPVSTPQASTGELFARQFETALEAIAARLDISTCSQAVVLLSSTLCFYRNTPLPFKSRAKVQQVLPLELAQTLPREDGTYITDFKVSDHPTEHGEYQVFSMSADEALIQVIWDGLTQKGIKPVLISPLASALAACCLKHEKNLSDFVLLVPENGQITALLAADRQTGRLSSIMPAEALAPDASDISKEKLSKALKRLTLGFNQKNGSNREFALLAVRTEDEQPFEGLPALMECEARAMDTLLPMLSPDRSNRHLFNLCRGKYGSDAFIRTHAQELIATGVLAVAAFLCLVLSLQVQISGFEKKIESKRQISAAIFTRTFPGKTIGNLDPLLAMQAALKSAGRESGRSYGDAAETRDISTVEILNELSVLIPDAIDVELSRLILEKGRLVLAGSTQNFNAVDQVKTLIEKSPVFKSVEISSAAAQKDGKRVEFKFIVEL